MKKLEKLENKKLKSLFNVFGGGDIPTKHNLGDGLPQGCDVHHDSNNNGKIDNGECVEIVTCKKNTITFINLNILFMKNLKLKEIPTLSKIYGGREVATKRWINGNSYQEDTWNDADNSGTLTPGDSVCYGGYKQIKSTATLSSD